MTHFPLFAILAYNVVVYGWLEALDLLIVFFVDDFETLL